MSGGGGYVMSRQAVVRLVTVGLEADNQERCPHLDGTQSEDVAIGKLGLTLGKLGLTLGELGLTLGEL